MKTEVMHDRRIPGRGRTGAQPCAPPVRVIGLFFVLLGLVTIMLGLIASPADVRALPFPFYELTKTVSYPPSSGLGASVGEIVTITVSFRSLYDSSSYVEVRDQNPAPWYLEILSNTITGGAYYIPGTIGVSEAVGWDDWLDIGEPVTVTFQLKVLEGGAGQTVTNLAWLDSAATPGTLYDAGDWAEIYIKPAAPVLEPIDNTDGDGDYLVAWEAATGAITYTLQVDDEPAFTSPITPYVGANTQFLVTGQAPGLRHYRVRASNHRVYSSWSNSEPASVLLPPPILYPIDNPNNGVDYWVDWSDVTGASAYTLEEDDDPDFASPITRYSGSDSHYQILDQTYGRWYYRVRAANAVVSGFWSQNQEALVRAAPVYLPIIINTWPPLPGVPVLEPINNPEGLHSFDVGWTTALRAETYVLQEATSATFAGAVQIYAGPGTGLEINRKQPTRYFYRVKARNDWGDSDWSNTEQVDVLWESEPNDIAPSQANGAIVSGLTYQGSFPSAADINDYYYFELKEQRSVQVQLTNIPAGHNFDLVLRNSALVPVGYSGELENKDERIVTGPLPAGTYYIQVYHRSLGSSGQAYRLQADYE